VENGSTQRAPAAAPWVGAAPDLAFAVTGAGRLEHAAAPTIRFGLRITSGGAAVRAIVLDVQVRIAATRRAYPHAADDRLFELFGARADWGTTLRSLLWTRMTRSVPPFTGETEVDLLVPCTYDLDVTATRYLDALPDGEVPLEFLFSGTVFYAADDGRLQTALLSWDLEAEYRLPVGVWRETIDHHFPGSAWLRLDRASHDRLVAYRSRRALPTWAAVIDELLPPTREEDGA
jgi:Family of unknown function (DUF6084)